MAIVYTGDRTVAAQTKTAGASWASIGLNTTTAVAGDLVVITVATDNVSTTDGNTNLHTNLTDTAGNTWTKVREFTNGQAAAAGGATVSVWYSVLTGALNAGQTLTLTLASSVAAKAMQGQRFTIGAGSTIAADAIKADLANDAADPGSMTLSGLANSEHLFFRATAIELATTTHTSTVGWGGGDHFGTSGGTGNTNMSSYCEWKIATATTSGASDPTVVAADCASVLVAFNETAGSGSALTQNVNDTLTLADAISLGPGLGLSETIALADARQFDIGLNLSEAIPLTEVVSLGFSTTIADTLTLADSLQANLGKEVTINDTLTLADSLAFGLGPGLSDTLALADTVRFDIGKGLADTLGLADSTSFGVGLGLSDAAALADAVAFGYGLGISDALGLSDFADPQITTGGAALTLDLADTLILADSVVTESGFNLSIADSLGLADSISTATGYNITVNDVLSVADAISLGYGKGLADALALTDAISKEIGLSLTDSLALLDSLSTQSAYNLTIADTLALTDRLVTDWSGKQLAATVRKWYTNRFGIY